MAVTCSHFMFGPIKVVCSLQLASTEAILFKDSSIDPDIDIILEKVIVTWPGALSFPLIVLKEASIVTEVWAMATNVLAPTV